jgi:hypothetical protein
MIDRIKSYNILSGIVVNKPMLVGVYRCKYRGYPSGTMCFAMWDAVN